MFPARNASHSDAGGDSMSEHNYVIMPTSKNMGIVIETEHLEGSRVTAVIKGLPEKVAQAFISLFRPSLDTFAHIRDAAYGGGVAVFNAMTDEPSVP